MTTPAQQAPTPQPSIEIWPWDDAPAELKALSPYGGDEDLVARIPARYVNVWDEELGGERLPGFYPYAIDTLLDTFCLDRSFHELDDGSVAVIGAHA